MSDTPAELAKATFAGGCFWCMEHPFDVLDGVISTTAGYAGGTLDNPTYEQVSAGITEHAEVVQVLFDPAKVSYAQLLAIYWRNIDPTTKDRQFCDVGRQYRSAIFYHDDQQKSLAQAAVAALEAQKPFSQPVVTEIAPLNHFWPAEAYHQDYYRKNPLRYAYYRTTCGRDARLQQLWGEPEK